MKEAQWRTCPDPFELLAKARRWAGARKLRLVACACCRQFFWPLTDPRSRQAVEASERFADGLIASVALRRARAATPGRGAYRAHWAAAAASHASGSNAFVAAEAALRDVMDAANAADEGPVHERLADLVRHIVGNPFRKTSVEDPWPSSLVQLAAALYAGQDCAFALHDALLETGHVDLAEHFHERAHPRGCWALDQLLASGGRQSPGKVRQELEIVVSSDTASAARRGGAAAGGTVRPSSGGCVRGR